jgi:hypothetical protein
MKPPTPFPKVSVIRRDGQPFTPDVTKEEREENGLGPTKQWFPLSIRIDDATLRRLDVLKQTFPEVSKAQHVRDAISFYAKHYPR